MVFWMGISNANIEYTILNIQGGVVDNAMLSSEGEISVSRFCFRHVFY